MQGSKKAPLPVSAGNASSCCLTAPLNQWKTQLRHPFSTAKRRLRMVPGLLPRLAVIQAAHSNRVSGMSSGLPYASGVKNEGENFDTAASAVIRRPTKPLYKVSEDPLLRQTQMLLEASRRLREQSVPTHNVDQQGYFGCSGSSSGILQDSVGQQRSLQRNDLEVRGGNGASALAQLAPDSANAVVTSFGALAAASATAAARLSAARSAVTDATAPSASAPAAFTPSASEPTCSAAVAGTTTGRAVLTAAAATATITAASAVMPPAASASGAAGLSAAAASAASVASSGWLVIEELLEEAAYSLSQEIPDGRGPSPLDTLMAATNGASGSASGPVLGMDLQQQLQGLGQSISAPVSLPLSGLGLGSGPSGPAGVRGLVAAVPGGDRLSEMLEDLLYSLSQDVNLSATQEAVLATASAVAAGLVGAASELPRAAASVYRSAAEAAAAAAAARAAAARGPSGGGSGGTALVVPDENQARPAAFDSEYDAGDVEAAAVPDMTESGNVAWDSYGTIRAGDEAATALDYSAATAGAATDAGGTAVASAASAAGDTAVAVLPPIISASAASSVADAATATAAAVVEAATTAAEGTIIITPPSLPPPSTGPTPPPVVSSAPSGTFAASLPQPQVAQPPAFSDGSASYGMDAYGYGAEDSEQLDELTAALQNLLAGPESLSSAAASGLEAPDAAAAAMALPDDAATSATEAALSTFTEALRRELGAVVSSGSDAVDTDPSALAQSAGLAVTSALESLSLEQQIGLSSLPQDLRLSTLLGATLQSILDLVESALGSIRSADSTLVGGITITVVLAVLIRSLVSLAGAALNRTRVGMGEAGPDGGDGSDSTARMRPVGVTALEAAAALNNDAQALLLDIRNVPDVREQGLPDLRPFRRGTGAATVSIPYCDFRTTPTLANPSGSLFADPGLLGKGSANAAVSSTSTALAPLPGTVTVSVDPMFCSKFKQLEGLNRDSRVFLIDSYGVESPEAVLLLRSDPQIERLLGAQGVKYVEGGFAGPEGWKLTGLPVADAPALPLDGSQGEEYPGLGLDLSGLLSGVAGLRLRYPSLFTRTLAVGAVGGAGVVAASSVDWGAVSRGAVGLAAAMLVTDRVLPSGVRPSGRIRQYLQSQLADPPLGIDRGSQGTSSAADLAARRRRTALLLRALDLAETVGDAVVRAGGVAVAAAGSVAKSAIGAAAATGPVPKATTADLEAELETPPAPATGTTAATIVLPHGMDSPQWSEAAEMAVAHGHQEQQESRVTASAFSTPHKQTRSASPLRPNWRLGPPSPSDSSSPSLSPAAAAATAAAVGFDVKAAAAVASSSELLPPPSPTPTLAGRLSGAWRNAANAVVRAASPSRTAASIAATSAPALSAVPRSTSPGDGGSSRPDTLELMAALATASALSNVDSGLVPGWPATSFPKASAGQVVATSSGEEESEEGGFKKDKYKEHASEQLDSASLSVFSSFSTPLQSSGMEAASYELADTTVHGSGRDLWSNWRQELEAVSPPPPALPSEEEKALGSSSGSSDTVDRDLYGNGSASVVASRLGLSSSLRWDVSPDGGAASGSTEATTSAAPFPISSNGSGSYGYGAHQQQSQERRPSRKLLRTSSPERAAAAGAALRQLRVEMNGLDDDGLSSGAYGNGVVYRSIFDDAAADGKRSGSAGVAAERMAPGRGGLSLGHPAGQEQPLDALFSGTAGSNVRQKQPLRTASPQRVAEAAAAMRKLRAEMGLPPNDGRNADALIPRDWRRELDAAAAASESFLASDSESEPAPGEINPLHSSLGGSSSSEHRSGVPAATAAPLPSPRNWRVQLEGRDPLAGNSSSTSPSGDRSRDESGAPAGWRAQIEGGGPAAAGLARGGNGRVSGNSYGHDTSGADGPFVPALRTTTSPGRAKLTAVERAARDARLQDWRARSLA